MRYLMNLLKNSKVMGYLFWIWLILTVTTSSIPNIPVPQKEILSLIRTDYLIHFFQFFLLSFFFVIWRQKLFPTPLQLTLILLAGAGFSVLMELQQLYIPERSFNIYDILANCFGFFFGLMVAMWLLLIISKAD